MNNCLEYNILSRLDMDRGTQKMRVGINMGTGRRRSDNNIMIRAVSMYNQQIARLDNQQIM